MARSVSVTTTSVTANRLPLHPITRFPRRIAVPIARIQSALDYCWNEGDIEWYQAPLGTPRRCVCNTPIVSYGVTYCSVTCETNVRRFQPIQATRTARTRQQSENAHPTRSNALKTAVAVS